MDIFEIVPLDVEALSCLSDGIAYLCKCVLEALARLIERLHGPRVDDVHCRHQLVAKE